MHKKTTMYKIVSLQISNMFIADMDFFLSLLGSHGSDSLCRDEQENKMAATTMY